MARNVLVLAAIGLTLLISSCGEPGLYLDVVEGNYAFSRGDYMSANLKYIQADREGNSHHRIYYNLGNVYHALGESTAALEEWETAGNGDDEVTRYRIAFNRGVLYYEQGSYQEAYRSFRRALKFRPEDIEAKVNLEYALRKQSLKEKEAEPELSEEEEPQVSDDGKRILEYVQRSAPAKLLPEERRKKEEEVKDW